MSLNGWNRIGFSRDAIHKRAIQLFKTSLYIGLTYIALFVGVGTCQGQGCGSWVYHAECWNGGQDNCGSSFPDCRDCFGRTYCLTQGGLRSIGCGCNDPPNPDNMSAGAAYNCATGGSGGWCRGGASLAMTATDSKGHAVTFSGSIGGGGFSCGAPCTQGIPEGVGSYTWTAGCSGGKTASGSGTYMVDSAPPILVAALSGGVPGLRGWYVGGTVTLTCTASDALSGLSGVSYGNQTASAEGNTNLSCTATDVAGNMATASYGVGIDTGYPALDLIYSGTRGHSGWYVTPVKIGVAASDGTSGIYSTGMQIDGGAWATSATVEDGEHYVSARAEDNAGHVSTTDAGSGIASVYISFNGGDWVRIGSSPEWTYEWDTTQFPDGAYEIKARADDVAGNEEHTAVLAINVDNTPPEVDLEEEWWAPASGEAGGSDAASGIGHARVTISRAGMVPWARDYDFVPSSIEWDNTDGNGSNAGYGDFDVTLEAWDVAGNYSVTHGVLHHIWPTPMPQPTAVPAVIADPTKAPVFWNPFQPKQRDPSIPLFLPFWALVLPMAGMGVWLAGSNIALSRDGRTIELSKLRKMLSSYRDQRKTNFPKGDLYD